MEKGVGREVLVCVAMYYSPTIVKLRTA